MKNKFEDWDDDKLEEHYKDIRMIAHDITSMDKASIPISKDVELEACMLFDDVPAIEEQLKQRGLK